MKNFKLDQYLSTLFMFFAFVFISCTSTPTSGPLPIKYNRDQCAECGMVISDPRFATQIRAGSDHELKAHVFDDVGCAIKFAKKKNWLSDKSIEFFIQDYETQKWISTLQAHYKKNKSSPMGYGYSAHENKSDDAINFDQLVQKIEE